jgi:hypothetical protein
MVCPACDRAATESKHSRSEHAFEEIRIVAGELVTYVVVIIIESCFLCSWALAIWGVASILDVIEPHMPTWGPTMFKYVEIGFAIYILSKLFVRRSHVLIEALATLHRVRRALTGGHR